MMAAGARRQRRSLIARSRGLSPAPSALAIPPAILIAWSAERKAWRATAIVDSAGEPIVIEGPSTSSGRTASEALQVLLDRRFGILVDQDCPATLASIEAADL